MGLEEIVGRINDEASERAAKIVADARAEASKILDDARERSESIVSQSRSQAERDAREEKLRSVASARLSAKRETLQAREDVLKRYESAILAAVDDFVDTSDYQKFLAGCMDDGLSKLGEDAIIHVNAKDRGSLKGKKYSKEVAKEPLDCKGGAMVMSPDGKRRVDNTIESLLRERSDAIRLMLVDQVFGDGQKRVT